MTKTMIHPDQMQLLKPDTGWVRPDVLPDLTNVDEIGLDTETNDNGLRHGRGPGWVWRSGWVCGVGVAWREGAEVRKIYVPIRHPETDNFDKNTVARWLTDITKNKRVIFHNAPYDIGWLHSDLGVPIPSTIDDTGCMAVLADESVRGVSPYSLNAIANRLGVALKEDQMLYEGGEVYGYTRKEVKSNIHNLPAAYVGPYGQQDPATTLECAEKLRPILKAEELEQAYQLEMDLIPMVHAMRKRGIRIDINHCEKAKVQLFARRDGALKKLQHQLGGRALTMDDIRSPSWVQATFDNAGVMYSKENSRGASFGKEWMRQGYVGRYQEGQQGHWLPQLIAEAKQAHEAAEKFVQGFLLDYANGGRIHANFNQFKSEDGGTRTHRFSITDPPLQQMPSRPEIFLKDWTLTGDIAKLLRGAFLPEPGEKWFSPDYSQQEYRLIVHYAARLGCSKADEAVQKYVDDPNTDFHNMVVEMTGLIRQRAKDCNFAKSYGAGLKKFADMTGMSEDEAKAVMTQYDGEMPFVRELMQRATKKADKDGYIRMLDGARMHFNYWEAAWLTKEERERGWREQYPMGECGLEEAQARTKQKGHPWLGSRLKRAFTHKAGNGLIQGGAARMGKMAMRDMWRAGYLPLLQMHDEFPLSIANERDGKNVAELMRNTFKARVPFRVDEEYGRNWADAKHPWDKAQCAN